MRSLTRSLCLAASLATAALCPAQAAATTPYGTGCYYQRASFFETFPTGSFDLGGTIAAPRGYSMIFIGEGYLVLPLQTAWRPPTAAASQIILPDDGVSPAQPLGFPLQYPGGTTESIWVSSNGFLTLAATTNSQCCAGDPVGMVSGPPRIAMLWMDMNPTAGGTIKFERSTANGGTAWLTFEAVREYGTNVPNTFQVAFYNYGQIDVLYGPCGNTGNTGLSGWSPGGNVLSPGAVNMSQVIQAPFLTGPDRDPLRIASTGRPRIGTTMPVTTSNVPANSPFVLVALGLQGYPQGLSLDALGMFGCLQYASFETSFGLVPSGGTATWQLAVPNNPDIVGRRGYLQSLAFAPDANGPGLITSNALDLLAGVQ